MFTKTRVVITVPSGVTEVERRAVEDAARAAGAQEVELIEEPMAAALGAGLPVFEAAGSMVVDIGGGTCDVAVMSLGGIAARKSVKIAGNALNEAIINHMKRAHNLLIGDVTAEDIKIKIGSVSEYDGEGAMEVRGRNLTDGLPNKIEITSEEIRNVLTEPVGEIVEAIRETLEVTLPELAADIIDRGIYITGGTALLRGLPELISILLLRHRSRELKLQFILGQSRGSILVWALTEHGILSLLGVIIGAGGFWLAFRTAPAWGPVAGFWVMNLAGTALAYLQIGRASCRERV